MPAERAYDVFISHASEDKQIADAVCATLEAKRIRCWIAPRDLLAGCDFYEQIDSAIDQSKVMVLVFSSHSNSSPYVPNEVRTAFDKQIPILPFRIEDVGPAKNIALSIRYAHWLDAITPPMENHLQKLADSITRLLPETQPAPSGTAAVATGEAEAASARRQYRDAVEVAWSDRRIDQGEVDWLLAAARRLNIGWQEAAAIEREVMGEPKGTILGRQREATPDAPPVAQPAAPLSAPVQPTAGPTGAGTGAPAAPVRGVRERFVWPIQIAGWLLALLGVFAVIGFGEDITNGIATSETYSNIVASFVFFGLGAFLVVWAWPRPHLRRMLALGATGVAALGLLVVLILVATAPSDADEAVAEEFVRSAGGGVAAVAATRPPNARPGVLLADDFDEPARGILPPESPEPENYRRVYRGGEYEIAITNTAFASLPYAAIPGEFTDAAIALDVRLDGPFEDRYVVVGCRDRPSGESMGYRLTLDLGDGTFKISRWDDDVPTELVAASTSPAIKKGNAVNRVELSCVGSTIAASINGSRVTAVQDDTYGRGIFWIGAGDYGSNGLTVTARFDNLEVFDPRVAGR